jgi:hypothetical protein
MRRGHLSKSCLRIHMVSVSIPILGCHLELCVCCCLFLPRSSPGFSEVSSSPALPSLSHDYVHEEATNLSLISKTDNSLKPQPIATGLEIPSCIRTPAASSAAAILPGLRDSRPLANSSKAPFQAANNLARNNHCRISILACPHRSKVMDSSRVMDSNLSSNNSQAFQASNPSRLASNSKLRLNQVASSNLKLRATSSRNRPDTSSLRLFKSLSRPRFKPSSSPRTKLLSRANPNPRASRPLHRYVHR